MRPVGATRQRTDRGPGGGLRALDDLVGQVLDVVQAVLTAERQQPLRAHLAGRHLGVEVAGHVVGLAHVGEDELPDVRVALTGDVELADRDPQALLEHVPAARADAVAADVGVVDGRAEEGDDPPVLEHRHEHRDVEELAGRLVRVVRDQHVAGGQRVGRVLVEDGRGAERERVDVAGRAGHRLRHHPGPAVEHGVGEVAGLPDDRAEGGPLERLGLLVHRGDQALPQDLELDGVERAAGHGAILPRVATSEPSVPTSTDQPGRMTAVVSRSSTMAGPSKRAPGPSASRR